MDVLHIMSALVESQSVKTIVIKVNQLSERSRGFLAAFLSQTHSLEHVMIEAGDGVVVVRRLTGGGYPDNFAKRVRDKLMWTFL